MNSGQDFEGRGKCGLGQCGLTFLRAEECGLRSGVKIAIWLQSCGLCIANLYVCFLGRPRWKYWISIFFLNFFLSFWEFFVTNCVFSPEKDIFWCGLRADAGWQKRLRACGLAGLGSACIHPKVEESMWSIQSIPGHAGVQGYEPPP